MLDFAQFMPVIVVIVIFLMAVSALYAIWEWVFSSRDEQDHDDSYHSYTTVYYDDYVPTKARKSYDITSYGAKDSLLSPAEISFYHVLKQVVGDNAIISPKVNLWDIFYIKRGTGKDFMALKAKIARKHVDFLLCHTDTLKPIIGIELDDKSHQQSSRQERDQFVDSVFQATGLPIVHIPARRAYNTNDIAELLRQYLLQARQPVNAHSPTRSSQMTCPNCGGEMILHTVKSGKSSGMNFWGCSNYPNCRQVLPYKG